MSRYLSQKGFIHTQPKHVLVKRQSVSRKGRVCMLSGLHSVESTNPSLAPAKTPSGSYLSDLSDRYALFCLPAPVCAMGENRLCVLGRHGVA